MLAVQESAEPVGDLAIAANFSGRCCQCNYQLRGLTSRRCPECGREFDPHDPETFYSGNSIGRLRKWWIEQNCRAILLWAVVTMVTGIVIRFFLLLREDDWLIALFASMLVGQIVHVRATKRNAEKYPAFAPEVQRLSRPRRLLQRIVWSCFLGLTLLGSFNCYSCVHGTVVGFAGVGIAHSEVGGPCHESPVGRSRHVWGNWYVWW
jgi:hypothetical protein